MISISIVDNLIESITHAGVIAVCHETCVFNIKTIMLQIILMIIAVYAIIISTISSIIKLASAIKYGTTQKLIVEPIFMTIGISYLIWFCN